LDIFNICELLKKREEKRKAFIYGRSPPLELLESDHTRIDELSKEPQPLNI
jgi:hypothetical protein